MVQKYKTKFKYKYKIIHFDFCQHKFTKYENIYIYIAKFSNNIKPDHWSNQNENQQIRAMMIFTWGGVMFNLHYLSFPFALYFNDKSEGAFLKLNKTNDREPILFIVSIIIMHIYPNFNPFHSTERALIQGHVMP